MTLPHLTDRRTVVKGAAALIVTPLLGGVAAADHDVGIALEVLQQSINPDSEGLIPTRVLMPGIPKYSPSDIFFGHEKQFVVERSGGEVIQVGLPNDAEVVLANPVRRRSVAGHDGHWIMHFRSQDFVYDGQTFDEVTMGLGYFPDETFVSPDHFDTDTVRFVPG